MSSVVETIREDRDEYLFLGFVALVTAWGILESLTLTRESRLVPLIILSLLVVVLVLTVVVKVLGTRYDLGFLTSSEGRFDLDEDPIEDAGIYDLNERKVVKHFLWLVAYTAALAYVGFWTTNVVFGIGYVMANETSLLRERVLYALTSTAFVLGILWILFVRLLKIQAIWRLGFLP